MSKILLNALKEKIKQAGSISLKLSGHSMYPTIKNGDEITIESCKFEDIQINDIIACYFNNSTHFIIHRVVEIENIHGKRILITKGDNNDHIDGKAVKESNFVGIVKIKDQINDIYELAPNIIFLKSRNCVVKCEDTIRYLPSEILPPIIHRPVKKINRALTTELIIQLSYRCNLNCIYCSNDSNNNIHVAAKTESIVKAITFVINNALILRKLKASASVKPARIVVSGGGEPTVEWNLLTFIVDTVKSFKSKYGNDIAELLILTNAQINDDKADYLIHNFDHIFISCDGFSTQDNQRPRIDGDSSKRYVAKFLDKLNRYNKKVSIRMTVTGEALPYLQDDVDYFLNSFKVVKDVVIEPFAKVGRGTDYSIKKLDYDDFIIKFDAIVRKYYNNVYNSVTLLQYADSYPCQRLSGISIVLSPYNVITCCDTVTPESELWESMIVGSLENNQIKILKEYVHSIPDECESCIAVDFCGGECPMHLNGLNDSEKTDLCKYKREMVRMELLRRVELSKKTKNIEFNGINYSVYTLPRGVL